MGDTIARKSDRAWGAHCSGCEALERARNRLSNKIWPDTVRLCLLQGADEIRMGVGVPAPQSRLQTRVHRQPIKAVADYALEQRYAGNAAKGMSGGGIRLGSGLLR